MNSLVVFLSMIAVATAKPSGGLLAYSAPIIASAPTAVSHQSRLDIKSTPAVITTAAIAPITRNIVAAPAFLAAPAIATAAIAPAAVSSQSRIDIKSTPAITNTVVSAPVAYSVPALAYGAPVLAYNAPLLTGAIAPAIVKTGYTAPAILKRAAIATPAFAAATISASDVPLDTPEVLAARAAHFEAQALADAHLIKKRSVPLVATSLLSTSYTAPIVTTYGAAPLASSYHRVPLSYTAPLALSTPLITKAYGLQAW